MARVSKANKDKLVEILEASGNVGVACQRIGIARSTYYEWKSRDPEFARRTEKAINMGNETVNDLAKAKLVNKIKDGDMGAIKYQLSHRDPDFKLTHVNNLKSTNQLNQTGFAESVIEADKVLEEKNIEVIAKNAVTGEILNS